MSIEFNEYTLFKLDGIGALLSTLLLGGILPFIHHLIGLPLHVFYLLGSLASLYVIYDFACLKWADLRHPKWLILIILANSFHIFLTWTQITIYSNQIHSFKLLSFQLLYSYFQIIQV